MTTLHIIAVCQGVASWTNGLVAVRRLKDWSYYHSMINIQEYGSLSLATFLPI